MKPHPGAVATVLCLLLAGLGIWNGYQKTKPHSAPVQVAEATNSTQASRTTNAARAARYGVALAEAQYGDILEVPYTGGGKMLYEHFLVIGWSAEDADYMILEGNVEGSRPGRFQPFPSTVANAVVIKRDVNSATYVWALLQFMRERFPPIDSEVERVPWGQAPPATDK